MEQSDKKIMQKSPPFNLFQLQGNWSPLTDCWDRLQTSIAKGFWEKTEQTSAQMVQVLILSQGKIPEKNNFF